MGKSKSSRRRLDSDTEPSSQSRRARDNHRDSSPHRTSTDATGRPLRRRSSRRDTANAPGGDGDEPTDPRSSETARSGRTSQGPPAESTFAAIVTAEPSEIANHTSSREGGHADRGHATRRDSRRDSRRGDDGSKRGTPRAGSGQSASKPDPASQFSSLPDHQFPGEIPSTYARPYLPVGEAAEYYGDQGESVASQPGIRPHPPSVITTADQAHLMEPSSEAKPPPEPSSVGQIGAAASYFAAADHSPSARPPAPRPGKLGKPGLQDVNVSPRTSPGPGGSRVDAQAHDAASLAGMAGAGAAAAYFAGAGSHGVGSQSRPSPPPTSYGTSHTPSKPALVGGAALAGAAAGAYLSSHAHSQQPPPGYVYGHSPNPGSASQVQHAHRHRRHGPLGKLIDWFRDPDAVAQYEQYTETIGVCKYCFDPRSSPADAPRKHHYRRRSRRLSSDARPGSSSRVDKTYRSSSEDERRRHSAAKRLVLGGVAGYGAAKIGETVLKRNHDFDDTYSVKSGRPVQDANDAGWVSSDDDRSQRRRDRPRHRERGADEKRRTSRRHSPSPLTSLPRGVAQSTPDVLTSGGAVRRRSRSRSPLSRKPHYSKRVSPRHSYVDLSTTAAGDEGVMAFFTSPSANDRKGKSSKGFFNFANASSSSSDADLAFGAGTVRSKTKRPSDRRPRRQSPDTSSTTLLGLVAAGTALAAESERRQSKGKGYRDAKDRTGRDHSRRARLSPNGAGGRNTGRDDEWYDTDNDDDQSSSGVDTSLAYGPGLSSLATRPPAYPTSPSFKPSYNRKSSGHIDNEAVIDPAMRTESDRRVASRMQELEPRPMSEGGIGHQRGGALIEAATVLPLHHPQPFAPVQTQLYDPSFKAPSQSAWDSDRQRPIESDSVLPNLEKARQLRDSNFAKQCSQDVRNSVSFNLTEEQLENERRASQKPAKSKGRRDDKARRKSADSATVSVAGSSSKENAGSARRFSEAQKPAVDSSDERMAEIERELKRLYAAQRQMEADKRDRDDVPRTRTTDSVATPGLHKYSSDDAGDDVGSPRDDEFTSPDASPTPKSRQERIAQMAARRVRSTPSPVHEDYSTFFVPKELQEHLREHNESAEHRDDVGANIVEVVPGGSRSMCQHAFDPFTYRPFGLDLNDDPSLYPWPVPRLGLVEPTPPGSRAHSVQGDPSPVIAPRSGNDVNDVGHDLNDSEQVPGERRIDDEEKRSQDDETTRGDLHGEPVQPNEAHPPTASALVSSPAMDEAASQDRDDVQMADNRAVYQSPFAETVSDLGTTKDVDLPSHVDHDVAASSQSRDGSTHNEPALITTVAGVATAASLVGVASPLPTKDRGIVHPSPRQGLDARGSTTSATKSDYSSDPEVWERSAPPRKAKGSRRSSMSNIQTTKALREPFLGYRPEMPATPFADILPDTKSVSGQASEVLSLNTSVDALEKPSAAVDLDSSSKDVVDTPGATSRQLATIQTTDVPPNAGTIGSPTAVPINFRRPPVSPINPRFAASSPIASPGSPLTTPRTRQGRPKSTEFRSSKEFRPLYLVERRNFAKTTAPDVMEEYPSLPSSRSSSAHPSLENLRGEARDLEPAELSSPRRMSVGEIRERARRHSYSYWHDDEPRRESPDYLDSRSATPVPGESQRAREKEKRPKLKYEFHSPSELLDSPSAPVDISALEKSVQSATLFDADQDVEYAEAASKAEDSTLSQTTPTTDSTTPEEFQDALPTTSSSDKFEALVEPSHSSTTQMVQGEQPRGPVSTESVSDNVSSREREGSTDTVLDTLTAERARSPDNCQAFADRNDPSVLVGTSKKAKKKKKSKWSQVALDESSATVLEELAPSLVASPEQQESTRDHDQTGVVNLTLEPEGDMAPQDPLPAVSEPHPDNLVEESREVEVIQADTDTSRHLEPNAAPLDVETPLALAKLPDTDKTDSTSGEPPSGMDDLKPSEQGLEAAIEAEGMANETAVESARGGIPAETVNEDVIETAVEDADVPRGDPELPWEESKPMSRKASKKAKRKEKKALKQLPDPVTASDDATEREAESKASQITSKTAVESGSTRQDQVSREGGDIEDDDMRRANEALYAVTTVPLPAILPVETESTPAPSVADRSLEQPIEAEEMWPSFQPVKKGKKDKKKKKKFESMDWEESASQPLTTEDPAGPSQQEQFNAPSKGQDSADDPPQSSTVKELAAQESIPDESSQPSAKAPKSGSKKAKKKSKMKLDIWADEPSGPLDDVTSSTAPTVEASEPAAAQDVGFQPGSTAISEGLRDDPDLGFDRIDKEAVPPVEAQNEISGAHRETSEDATARVDHDKTQSKMEIAGIMTEPSTVPADQGHGPTPEYSPRATPRSPSQDRLQNEESTALDTSSQDVQRLSLDTEPEPAARSAVDNDTPVDTLAPDGDRAMRTTTPDLSLAAVAWVQQPWEEPEKQASELEIPRLRDERNQDQPVNDSEAAQGATHPAISPGLPHVQSVAEPFLTSAELSAPEDDFRAMPGGFEDHQDEAENIGAIDASTEPLDLAKDDIVTNLEAPKSPPAPPLDATASAPVWSDPVVPESDRSQRAILHDSIKDAPTTNDDLSSTPVEVTEEIRHDLVEQLSTKEIVDLASAEHGAESKPIETVLANEQEDELLTEQRHGHDAIAEEIPSPHQELGDHLARVLEAPISSMGAPTQNLTESGEISTLRDDPIDASVSRGADIQRGRVDSAKQMVEDTSIDVAEPSNTPGQDDYPLPDLGEARLKLSKKEKRKKKKVRTLDDTMPSESSGSPLRENEQPVIPEPQVDDPLVVDTTSMQTELAESAKTELVESNIDLPRASTTEQQLEESHDRVLSAMDNENSNDLPAPPDTTGFDQPAFKVSKKKEKKKKRQSKTIGTIDEGETIAPIEPMKAEELGDDAAIQKPTTQPDETWAEDEWAIAPKKSKKKSKKQSSSMRNKDSGRDEAAENVTEKQVIEPSIERTTSPAPLEGVVPRAPSPIPVPAQQEFVASESVAYVEDDHDAKRRRRQYEFNGTEARRSSETFDAAPGTDPLLSETSPSRPTASELEQPRPKSQESMSDVSASTLARRKRRRSPPAWSGDEPQDLSKDRSLTPPPDDDVIMDTALGVAAGLGFGNRDARSTSSPPPPAPKGLSLSRQPSTSWSFTRVGLDHDLAHDEGYRDSGVQFESPVLATDPFGPTRDSGFVPGPADQYGAARGDHLSSHATTLRPPRPQSPTSSTEDLSDALARNMDEADHMSTKASHPTPVEPTSKDRSSVLFHSSPAEPEVTSPAHTKRSAYLASSPRGVGAAHGSQRSEGDDGLRRARSASDRLAANLIDRPVETEVDRSLFSPATGPPLDTIREDTAGPMSHGAATASAFSSATAAKTAARDSQARDAKVLGTNPSRPSPARGQHTIPPLSTAAAAPAAAAAVAHVTSASAETAVHDPTSRSAPRDMDMAEVYDGYGSYPPSPRSPTKPPSVRRRQSMQQIKDLEARLEQMASENRALAEAKMMAEQHLEQAHFERNRSETSVDALQNTTALLEERNAEIARLQAEVAQLVAAHASLKQEHEEQLTGMRHEHDAAQSQWQDSSRELDTLRSRHAELSSGMESIVRHEIDAALAEKNAEVDRLRQELETARENIRDLQAQILEQHADDVLVLRNEDYFDDACQKLCQQVQTWVLRFSKYSDHRVCRGTNEVRDDQIVDRFDNAILDGSDVDAYLGDRVRRRDVFMSVVMTMVWEFIFTRYLFGMDRDQRQKLKQLEKNLGEVGSPQAVRQWRALTLSLLCKRGTFKAQQDSDTEAVALEIFDTLSRFLPPPQNLEQQVIGSLRGVMQTAVELSIEMRTQRAEYVMLPPLQPEYDANGDLVRNVYFNASLMNERSGETTSNDELEQNQAIVRMVLFPLVVKKGDDNGVGDDEIVVCPAQVLIARPDKGKRVRPAASIQTADEQMSVDARSMRAASTHSLPLGPDVADVDVDVDVGVL